MNPILAACKLGNWRVLVRIPLPFVNPMNGESYLEVPVHGTMMMIGFLAAFLLLRRLAKRDGISQKIVSDLLMVCMLSGVLGARIFFAIQNGLPVGQWIKVWHGGLVWYGGLFGAIICGALFLYIAKLMDRPAPIAKIMDASAPATMLGLVFGRIGCFLNGCCWGGQVEGDPWWAVRYINVSGGPEAGHQNVANIGDLYSAPLHPAQLYSAAMVLTICLVLLVARRWRKVYGEQILLMFVLYAPVRYLLEMVRSETPKTYLGFFTPGQIVSMMIFIPALVGLVVLRLKGPRMEDYDASLPTPAGAEEEPTSGRPRMKKKKLK